MKRINYFTASNVATTAELADIAKLNTAAVAPFDVHVFSQSNPNYGYGKAEADYVAGAPIPAAYSAVPVADPDNPPGTSAPLPATSAIVTNASTLAIENSAGADSHNVTLTVAANAVTAAKLAATVAFVDNADAITVQNSAGAAVAGTHSASVTAGVVANVKLAATIAPVASGFSMAVTGTGTTATLTVTNGVITAITLNTP